MKSLSVTQAHKSHYTDSRIYRVDFHSNKGKKIKTSPFPTTLQSKLEDKGVKFVKVLVWGKQTNKKNDYRSSQKKVYLRE